MYWKRHRSSAVASPCDFRCLQFCANVKMSKCVVSKEMKMKKNMRKASARQNGKFNYVNKHSESNETIFECEFMFATNKGTPNDNFASVLRIVLLLCSNF